MTKDFSLDKDVIRLNKLGSAIPYSRIDSVEIFEGIKVSKKKFMIVFWFIWLGGTATLLAFQGGISFGNYSASTITSLALMGGLGLLAANPIYNMFPQGTFLRLWYSEKFVDLDISELTTDDRIHALIHQLKNTLGVGKIKIKKE
jgi:hypothetical protein